MIKNIVFDIGNVLVNFCWRELMDELGLSKEEKDRFESSVFGSKWWHQLDHGTIEEEDAVERLREDNAEYREAFDLVWENRGRLVSMYPYTMPWIQSLQEEGYKVYLLSNYPEKLFTLHEENGSLPFTKIADGKVVSAFVKMIKPNKDIYEYLMKKYDLKAEECVFLDDRADNVEAAEKLGMRGICFQGYKEAVEKLDRILEAEELRR